MDQHWTNFINQEKEKKYYHDLIAFLSERKKEVAILPQSKEIFNCFKPVIFNHLKVIIIGQDPYPFEKHSSGLAFSSPSAERPAPLQNIFKEIWTDYFFSGGVEQNLVQKSNNLTQWAEQGVLLLNTCLTCEVGAAKAHRGKGWELFIENLIHYICKHSKFKLVFMLWGTEARKMKKYITEEHLILETDHPSAVSHNEHAWFGNKHFSKANNFINKHYKGVRSEINWGIY